jgi:cbb3-type cytochrome oxidase subunit 3
MKLLRIPLEAAKAAGTIALLGFLFARLFLTYAFRYHRRK